MNNLKKEVQKDHLTVIHLIINHCAHELKSLVLVLLEED